jgi:2-phosphosulfolactate phosphatase
MPQIETCFSPALFSFRDIQDGFITVVVDVLRATSAFCAAFDAGVDAIIPVANLEQLKVLQGSGCITAAERDGKKVDFADFGNSPTLFLKADLSGKTLAYSTTNGTRAIELASSQGFVTVASFANLDAVSSWLARQQKDIVILCSGWKNSFSLEDSVCAGAVAEYLVNSGLYSYQSDSVLSSLQLWDKAKDNLLSFCSQGSHYKRLEKLGLKDDLAHCFCLNSSKTVPVWDGDKLVRADA